MVYCRFCGLSQVPQDKFIRIRTAATLLVETSIDVPSHITTTPVWSFLCAVLPTFRFAMNLLYNVARPCFVPSYSYPQDSRIRLSGSRKCNRLGDWLPHSIFRHCSWFWSSQSCTDCPVYFQALPEGERGSFYVILLLRLSQGLSAVRMLVCSRLEVTSIINDEPALKWNIRWTSRLAHIDYPIIGLQL
jgi:hypothetical protein